MTRTKTHHKGEVTEEEPLHRVTFLPVYQSCGSKLRTETIKDRYTLIRFEEWRVWEIKGR